MRGPTGWLAWCTRHSMAAANEQDTQHASCALKNVHGDTACKRVDASPPPHTHKHGTEMAVRVAFVAARMPACAAATTAAPQPVCRAHRREVLAVCVDRLEQVAAQVAVAAGKQARQAGHHALDELVAVQGPAAAAAASERGRARRARRNVTGMRSRVCARACTSARPLQASAACTVNARNALRRTRFRLTHANARMHTYKHQRLRARALTCR